MKNYIVTGSTKGIGFAVVKELLNLSHKDDITIYMSFVHDKEQAAKVFEEISQYKNCHIDLKQVDLSEYGSALEYCKYIKSKCTSIDALILNVAITDRTRFEDFSIQAWEKVMRTNVNIPVFMIQALLDILKVKPGCIVMTGSLIGTIPHSTVPVYGISKAALHGAVKNMVKVLAPYGIRINAVAPGFVETFWFKDRPKEWFERIKNKIAVHRWGEAAEIAKAYLFLIEDKYINGSILKIDGGYSYE
jgi:3-oxoacyl-[acyl-carrier protein] reductase